MIHRFVPNSTVKGCSTGRRRWTASCQQPLTSVELCTGQCFDVDSEQPTPGVEFVLGNTIHHDLYDTIVMANLGYFQLKATPGAFTLRLREGRSKDVYFIHRLILFINFGNASSRYDLQLLWGSYQWQNGGVGRQ